MNSAVRAYIDSIEPVLVILDEMKPLPGNEHESPADALISLMNEVGNDSRVAFIATANTLDNIPDTIKSRFSGENCVINFPLPNVTVLKSALEYHIKRYKEFSVKYPKKSALISENCTDDDFLSNLATQLKGLTQRDVERFVSLVVQRSKKTAIAKIHEARSFDSLEIDLANMSRAIITQQNFLDGVRAVQKQRSGYLIAIKQFCCNHPTVCDFAFRTVEIGAHMAFNLILHKQNMNMTERHHLASQKLAIDQFEFSKEQAARSEQWNREMKELQEKSLTQQAEQHKESMSFSKARAEVDDVRNEQNNPSSFSGKVKKNLKDAAANIAASLAIGAMFQAGRMLAPSACSIQ